MTDDTKRQSIADKLNETFEIRETAKAEEKAVVEFNAEKASANDDFSAARDYLAEIAKKGMSTLDKLIDIASERENARDFEVVAQFLKVNADVAKDMIAIHKKKKELEDIGSIPPPVTPSGLTQNNTTIFVGSTADLLAKMNEEQKAEDENVVEAEIIEDSE